MIEQQFKHMSADSSARFTICVNEVLLNEYAVKAGLFDKFISNIYSADDYLRWKEILPYVTDRMNKILNERRK